MGNNIAYFRGKAFDPDLKIWKWYSSCPKEPFEEEQQFSKPNIYVGSFAGFQAKVFWIVGKNFGSFIKTAFQFYRENLWRNSFERICDFLTVFLDFEDHFCIFL